MFLRFKNYAFVHQDHSFCFIGMLAMRRTHFVLLLTKNRLFCAVLRKSLKFREFKEFIRYPLRYPLRYLLRYFIEH